MASMIVLPMRASLPRNPYAVYRYQTAKVYGKRIVRWAWHSPEFPTIPGIIILWDGTTPNWPR